MHRCCSFIWTGSGLQKIIRFVHYTPVMKCFNNIVQAAVNAGRNGDENPSSSVVAQTLELLANSSYEYQFMKGIPDTVTKYLSNEETHGAIFYKMFNRLGYIK